MKLPTKVKIGGHWINIEFRSDQYEQYDKMGTCCHWENRIILQKDLTESKQVSSLFHESLHEMDKQQYLGLTEAQIATISEGFYTFLVDNGFLKED